MLQVDQFIIDALNASGTTKTVADTISGAADNLTLAAMREAARLLDVDGVPDSGRFLAVHANGLHHLLEDTQVTSSDYNTVKALVSGDLDTYYGFKIIKLGDRPNEGGLPVPSASHRTSFAWHMDAMGAIMSRDIEIRVDYVPEKGADFVSAFVAANAKAIDATGIVSIETDES